MHTIREQQLDIFKQRSEEVFVEELVDHCYIYSPELCKALERSEIRAVARDAIVRGRYYNLKLRGPLRLYLELMILLGSEFDSDPQYPWARETLLRDDFFNDMFKSGRLKHQVEEYLSEVNGPNNRNALRALLAIKRLAEKDPIVADIELVMDNPGRVLSLVFPEKHRYLGQVRVAGLIENAENLASAVYGETSSRAISVLVILAVAFGHCCHEDPLYAWIGRTLRDPKIVDGAARADRLERKAITWMRAVLETPRSVS